MKLQKVKKIAGAVVGVVLAVVLVALFIAVGSVLIQMTQGKTPTLFGYRFYYVLTDSMTPTYGVGDVVLSKEVNSTDTQYFTPGYVVTYTAEFGEMEGKQVTHRIIEGVHFDSELNDYVVTTKGDKAGAAVDKPVRLSRINAVVIRKLTVVSWVYSLVRNGFGFLLLFIVPLGVMLVVLIVRLITVIKKEKEPTEEATPSEEERVAEIKRRAIEEYQKQHETSEKVEKKDE